MIAIHIYRTGRQKRTITLDGDTQGYKLALPDARKRGMRSIVESSSETARVGHFTQEGDPKQRYHKTTIGLRIEYHPSFRD